VKDLKKAVQILKKEVATLKDSNENHIFINEKLNRALKKKEE
jgi:16S rRNA G966 N2-methylase RsmD